MWRVSEGLRITAGLEYQFWNGNEHSQEDGDKLKFSSGGVTLGVEYCW